MLCIINILFNLSNSTEKEIFEPKQPNTKKFELSLKPFEKSKKQEKRAENAIDDEVQRIPSSSQNTGSQSYTQSKEYNQSVYGNIQSKDLKDMTHLISNNGLVNNNNKSKINPSNLSNVNFQLGNFSKTNRKAGGKLLNNII